MVDTARWGFPAEMSQTRMPKTGLAPIDAWLGDASHQLRSFAREKPEQAMLWALGIGFVIGWKLKPW